MAMLRLARRGDATAPVHLIASAREPADLFYAAELAGDITASRSAASRLSLEIDRHVLRAPVSGRLADVASLHAGSYVPEGQRLGVIVPKGQVQLGTS